ncbi:PAAR domain-containing protein [Lelliottia wanjuensis]|uniref:PAAR domain-containing protein n=1 Tax=Lelliottia wanjuensis TaxID=3050585 RepID=A0AAP4FW98_9ENTR|nr:MULTISPECIES: PAAR domain-containing protein [unclassified Lelliottia]MDK9364654.1 PAAR domain-containing protein [Lelliottia sp. V106_12]MDK9583870.1 PAAR domain-containing protein [Lelliottia sp. V86_10]MDK9617550.1 PAAR domain-containing protein [Lelliottia sp. V106_9]
MPMGYYLVMGDKTTCGGVILEGDPTHLIMGKPVARELDRVTCGKLPPYIQFPISGSIPGDVVNMRNFAGTLHSKSTCPCQSRFIPSMVNDFYEMAPAGGGAGNSASAQDEPDQHAQSAKKDQFGNRNGSDSEAPNDDDSDNDNKKLSYTIELSGNKILTPLNIPDFEEMISGGDTKNTEKIDFVITNTGDEPGGLALEVVNGNTLLYSEYKLSEFYEPGAHHWSWDGYSNKGILDTKMLKSPDLLVRLIAVSDEQKIRIDYVLNNSAEQEDWVDVKVNKNTQSVDIEWRVGFEDGGISGSNTTLKPIGYAGLQSLAKSGIEFYWSRNGTRGGGIGDGIVTDKGNYKASVVAIINAEPMMSEFDLIENLDNEYGRSTSLVGLRKVNHNLGYYYDRYLQGKEKDGYIATENQFKLDSAHEMGHIVLNKYAPHSSPDYSWSHKGTSTVFTQESLSNNKMPRTGEVDLMKYSDDHASAMVQYFNSVAASEDVNGLIWLSRVKFNA